MKKNNNILSDDSTEGITGEMYIRDVKKLYPKTMKWLRFYKIASFGCG